jgi:hypothetical protein
MTYIRFFAMIATSTVVMFILMYLNTYLLSHIFWSETRAYMAVLMGAIMAIIMLGFMLSHVLQQGDQRCHLYWRRRGVCRIPLAGPEPGDRGRYQLHEGNDPAPFDRDHDIEPRQHF